MKTRTFLRRILVTCLIVLSLGTLAAASLPGPPAAVAGTPVPTSQGLRFPRLLQVRTVMQSRYTSCGEAVITMAYNYANPETPVKEESVIDYAVEQGYFTEHRWPFTSPANMVNIAEHYARDLRTGTVTTQEEGLALLTDQLKEGEPVIIDVVVRMYEPDSAPHFILVTGLSVDASKNNAVMVHYNDPLSGKSWVRRWDGNEGVWNAWKNNRDPGGSGWWLVIPPP